MGKARPDSTEGLAALYIFDYEGVKQLEGGGSYVVDRWVFEVHEPPLFRCFGRDL